MPLQRIAVAVGLVVFLAGCSRAPEQPQPTAARTAPSQPGAYSIYVTNERSGDLTIIDSANHEVVATIPLGKRPRGIHAAPDGLAIYVALSGSPFAPPGVDESTLPPPDRSADGIGVFDPRRKELVRVIKSGTDPEEFDITRDGALLFVSNEDAAQASVVEVATGAIRAAVPVGEEPEGVTVSPDGKFVYVTCEDPGTIAVIDASTYKPVKSFKVGRRPRSVAFLPDSSRAYVTAENDGAVVVVDATRHRPIQQISLGQPGVIKPMHVIMSPDGRRAYVSTGRGRQVCSIDIAANKMERCLEVGDRPWGITLSPDGKFLYSANGPSDDVSVVDLNAWSVVKKIKSPRSPWGVITLPNK